MFWTMYLPSCVFHYCGFVKFADISVALVRVRQVKCTNDVFLPSTKSARKVASTLVTVSDKTGTRNPLDSMRVGANVAPSAF